MRKPLRLLVVGLALSSSTTPSPAVLHPENGCSFIIWGGPDKMFSYCYPIDGGGCLGGYHHPCCD